MRTARRAGEALNPFRPSSPANGKDYTPLYEPATSRFRSWAVRADRWACELLDSIDWRRLDVRLDEILGVAVTGAILYLAYAILDAWIQGRFNVGGR